MLALNVVTAPSDAEARRLFTSQQLGFINLRRGRPGLIQPPVDDIDAVSTAAERAGVHHALACAVVGDPQRVRDGIAAFVARHEPDELLVTANIFDHALRLRSFEMTAVAVAGLLAARGAPRQSGSGSTGTP
jgi:alkanesulfonate monooxygenase SsuD/methylene tetrahydromethanopterin reductase-like flavin-dependent oxidoreductase (luciferase family)